VLDVWITAEGSTRMKDEDELRAAVEQGFFSEEEARQIEADARAALQTFHDGAFPFADTWRDWRPRPAWERPDLPGDLTWELDLLDA
jgi:predicted RNA-binding protein associated with RNAse of E/G family